MTFERTTDYQLIRQIVTHPKVYPHISDDGSPSVAFYEPPQSDVLWYVLVKDGDEVLGMFIFHPHNTICYEVHTCLLPESWGSRAALAGQGMAEWMFANSHARRIVTNVPDNNRLALRFAKRCGMVEFGSNPASFLKDGHLHAQIMLGISKEPSCH